MLFTTVATPAPITSPETLTAADTKIARYLGTNNNPAVACPYQLDLEKLKGIPPQVLQKLPMALVEIVQFFATFKAPARVLNFYLNSHQLKDQSKVGATIQFAIIVILSMDSDTAFELAKNQNYLKDS